MQPQPPRRSTHASGGPKTLLVYDRWGAYGRPVLLLHGLLFDRMMWWPVAAELATASTCTVVAPDLPGHGQTPPREDCSPSRIARDLATLINNLDLHRAPVIVGHATAAPLAHAFASAYATHHVLTLDEPAETPAGVDDVIAAARVSEVPEFYRPYAQPREDPELLAPYRSWLRKPTAEMVPAGRPALTRFAHLADPEGFAAGLRDLL
jgi:pimeloyl-ACP methyl ester carboxylesterase